MRHENSSHSRWSRSPSLTYRAAGPLARPLPARSRCRSHPSAVRALYSPAPPRTSPVSQTQSASAASDAASTPAFQKGTAVSRADHSAACRQPRSALLLLLTLLHLVVILLAIAFQKVELRHIARANDPALHQLHRAVAHRGREVDRLSLK